MFGLNDPFHELCASGKRVENLGKSGSGCWMNGIRCIFKWENFYRHLLNEDRKADAEWVEAILLERMSLEASKLRTKRNER